MTQPAVPLTAGCTSEMVAPTATQGKTITARPCQLQRLVGRRRSRQLPAPRGLVQSEQQSSHVTSGVGDEVKRCNTRYEI